MAVKYQEIKLKLRYQDNNFNGSISSPQLAPAGALFMPKGMQNRFHLLTNNF
jgi:hypothetical protein